MVGDKAYPYRILDDKADSVRVVGDKPYSYPVADDEAYLFRAVNNNASILKRAIIKVFDKTKSSSSKLKMLKLLNSLHEIRTHIKKSKKLVLNRSRALRSPGNLQS